MRKNIPPDILTKCISEYDGDTKTVPVLSRKYGLNENALYQALYRRGISHRAKSKHPSERQQLWFSRAKSRAKVRGITWTLKPEDIVVPAVCPVLGIPLFFSSKWACPNSPSLDRIDPTGGYTKDNVWVVSWRANILKRDATLTELRGLVDALEAEIALRKSSMW